MSETMVFIYRIEELVMLSRKLIANSIHQFPQARLALISQLLDRFISQVGFNDLEHENVTNILDASRFWSQKTRRILPKYEKLREIYEELSDELKDSEQFISYVLHFFLSLHFFLLDRFTSQVGFNDLEHENVTNILDASRFWSQKTRRILPKYEKLREIYEELSDESKDSEQFISYELMNKCGMESKVDEIRRALLTYQNDIDQGWLGVKELMKLVKQKACRHFNHEIVVLCEDGIAHASAILLLSGLASEIAIENVYSTATESIESVLKKIKRRFGAVSDLSVTTMDSQTALCGEKLQMLVIDSNCYKERENKYDDYSSVLKCYYC